MHIVVEVSHRYMYVRMYVCVFFYMLSALAQQKGLL